MSVNVPPKRSTVNVKRRIRLILSFWREEPSSNTGQDDNNETDEYAPATQLGQSVTYVPERLADSKEPLMRNSPACHFGFLIKRSGKCDSSLTSSHVCLQPGCRELKDLAGLARLK